MSRNKSQVFGGKVSRIGGVYVAPLSATPATHATNLLDPASGYKFFGIVPDEDLAFRSELETTNWTDHDGDIYNVVAVSEETTGDGSIVQINADTLAFLYGLDAVEDLGDYFGTEIGNRSLDRWRLVFESFDETGKHHRVSFHEVIITSNNEVVLGTDGQPLKQPFTFTALQTDAGVVGFRYTSKTVVTPPAAPSV